MTTIVSASLAGEKLYKVLNKKECHHGFQYKEGLNSLPQDECNTEWKRSFDPCYPHGLYFCCDMKTVAYFLQLGFGDHVREVYVPVCARVVGPSDSFRWPTPFDVHKYRTDKLILGRRLGDIELVRELVQAYRPSGKEKDFMQVFTQQGMDKLLDMGRELKLPYDEEKIAATIPYCEKKVAAYWRDHTSSDDMLLRSGERVRKDNTILNAAKLFFE